MGLKPIGSERLEGQEKLARIHEIARYKENKPSQDKTLQTESYSIQLADGNTYKIIYEKNGYIIKKSVNESFDYMEPMKNRRYYSSYSDAFKRLNLIAKEMNTLHENKEGVSLFGEQKKFVLKTPKPELPPAAPAPAPEPPPMDMNSGGDMGMDSPAPEGDVPPMDGETPVDIPGGETPDMGGDMGGEVSFKQIQKLTGKLGQKLREYKVSGEMSSKDIKYIINSILSALDLTKLDEGDREDILAKFELDEMGDMNMDMTADDGIDMEPQADGEMAPIETEMGEGWDIDEMNGLKDEDLTKSRETAFTKEIVDSIFGESKVEKVLTKYFTKNKNEKLFEAAKRKTNTEKKNLTMNEVRKFSESIEQETTSEKFLSKNPNYIFVGKTNKKNLVFEYSDKQIKITKDGKIL